MTTRIHPGPARREETILYLLLVAIGALPMIGPLAAGAAFGAEPTVGLALVVLGLVGLIRVNP